MGHFSVLAGASLFGFVGMLIALPVSAVINVYFIMRMIPIYAVIGMRVKGSCLYGKKMTKNHLGINYLHKMYKIWYI